MQLLPVIIGCCQVECGIIFILTCQTRKGGCRNIRQVSLPEKMGITAGTLGGQQAHQVVLLAQDETAFGAPARVPSGFVAFYC
ncbi:hypothetical protein Ppb6_03296 [Photorhabdus australis subsp. thailandensis]|uniref:Uncharacterized protein n=1 Tax=Photorhabdus australis subsp. thailandensis TaxID=2805096 RepID=A0A1C0U105_9GAMM|nr:hypothetical protein Ppb6_03296 [Photorhabdus australis subsp. thailandensis]